MQLDRSKLDEMLRFRATLVTMLRVVPSWSRLKVIFGQSLVDRLMGYSLAALGFAVTLRARLIGDSDVAVNTINGSLLLLACVLVVACMSAWKAAETILYIRIPQEISEYGTLAKYIEQIKKGAFDEETFKTIHDDCAVDWLEKNSKANFYSRALVTVVLVLSIFLYMIFLAVLYLSLKNFLSVVLSQIW